MIASPDVQIFELGPRDRFLLLGCDGFWGVFSPSDAVKLTTSLLTEGLSPKAITNRLINEVLATRLPVPHHNKNDPLQTFLGA